MKKDIHPKYEEIQVSCSCGNQFTTRSTLCRALTLEVCEKCHPFYTGQVKVISAKGGVAKFQQRYQDKQYFAKNTIKEQESDKK